MASKPTEEPDAAQVWCRKVEAAAAAAALVRDETYFIHLALRVLDHALLCAEVNVEFGYEPVDLDVRIEQPQCFVCGKSTLEEGGNLLYCSAACKDVAHSVRYARKKIDLGAAWDAETLAGFGQHINFWLVSGQPYDVRGRALPSEIRSAVLARSDGKCVKCGQPATQIHHIAGGSSDPSNLEGLCAACHHEMTLAGLVPITDPEKCRAFDDRLDYIADLIAAPEPLTPGLDHTTWSARWSKYSKLRKACLDSPSLTEKLRLLHPIR